MAADLGATRRVLLRALLGLLAGLVLLASGIASPPAQSTRTAALTAGATAELPAAASSLQRSGDAVVVRPDGPAAVPAPASPGAGLLPGTRPAVAPHLVAEPQSRPPSAPLAAAGVLAAGSRAPPVPAGL